MRDRELDGSDIDLSYFDCVVHYSNSDASEALKMTMMDGIDDKKKLFFLNALVKGVAVGNTYMNT